MNNQMEFSRSFDEAITRMMSTLVTTPIFSQAANVGAVCLLISIFPASMSIVRMYHADMPIDRDSIVYKVIIIILIAILIGVPTQRGRFLGNMLVGFNSFLNAMSDKVLVATSGENGVTAVAQSIVKANVEQMTAEGIVDCSKQSKSNARLECLQKLKQDVIIAVDPWVDEQWARQLSVLKQGDINKASNYELEYGGGNYFAEAGSKVDRMVGQGLIIGVCWAIGQSFIVALEHIKILMILVAPIFLGLQLVPLFTGFFGAWLKNYIMIELGHMVFNLLISLVAVTSLSASNSDGLVFPLLVAGFSIVMSLALVAGGGISLYTSGTQAVGTGMSMLKNAAN